MKKTKILLASVAVASLAAGCGIFAACNNTPSYNITFDANGGVYGEESSVTLKTGSDGKLTALPENDPTYAEHEFDGYNTASDGSGSKVTVDKEYTTTTTVYAQWSNIYTVTFVPGTEGTLATGAAATAKTTKGKLTALPEVTVTAEKKSFLGWYTTQSGEGDEITVDYVFSGDTLAVNAYARYRDEYTVTLSAGTGGTIATGTTLTYVTKNGKIDGYLPDDKAVTCTKENWQFGGWLDGETEVDEREYVFEKDTTLTAKYVRKDGFWSENGNDLLAALVLNTGNADTSLDEYWFGAGQKKTFAANTVLTVYINGEKKENFWLKGSCIEGGSGTTTSSITVTEAAEFVVYIKLYKNGGTTYEVNGKSLLAKETDTLPQGAAPIVITVKGTNSEELGTITFYIVNDDGVAINSSNADKYQLYVWDGGTQHLGAWGTEPKLSETENLVITSDIISSDTYWKLHWGENSGKNRKESSGMQNVEVGNVYVLDLSTEDAFYRYTGTTGGQS